MDEAVRLQEDAGLDVVTDGELRRYAFFGHLIDALDGFDKFGGWAIPFHDEQGERAGVQAARRRRQAPLAAQHVPARSSSYLRARDDAAGQGRADQRPAGGRLL